MSSSGFNLPNIAQVGIVVQDLEAAMGHYSRALGLGPWRVHTNSAPPLKCTYHGEPASYRVKLGITKSGPLVIELIQYLEGDTIHRDFSEGGREGLEHLGIYVPNLEEALAPFREMGVGVLQQAEGFGASRDGRYAYLDTTALLGTIIELIQPASEQS